MGGSRRSEVRALDIDMSIGGMVWTLGEMTGLYEQIAWFAERDFTGISFHTQPDLSQEWATFDVRKASRDDRERLDDALAPFKEASIHGESFVCDILLESPNDLVRRASVESLRQTIELAAEVGVAVVTLHKGKAGAQWAPQALRDAFARTLDELGQMTAGTGVTAAIENEPGVKPDYDLIMQADASVGVTIDVGHICMNDGEGYREFGTIGNLIRHLGDRVAHVHVHDYDGKQDHLAVGSGLVDWRDVLGALVDTGYSGMLCMEYSPTLTTPQDYVDGRKRLQDTLGGL